MKVVAYTALLYGAPYLGAAIQSVIDAVDRYIVLYSPTPSHNGGVAQLPNPDTKERLFSIAHTVAGNKLVWIEGKDWKYENQQRGAIWDYEPNADVVLVLDSDECYADGLAQDAIDFALHSTARNIRLPFLHLWRSFKRGFMHDPAYPVRVICPQHHNDETVTMPTEKRVWHFGYALPVKYVAYKTSGIHGHQSEFRKDVNWLEDVYKANRQYDCHIVGSQYWNCEDIPQDLLPTPLKYHPYYGLDLIE